MASFSDGNVLLTIHVSHFCEKARWALERAGVPYREECHMPPFTRFVGRRHGAWSTVPLLVTPSGAVPESSAILRWADERMTEERRIYPRDPSLRREVEELERRFDAKLGPHARRLLYFHVLPDRELTMELLAQEVPSWEARAFRTLFPVLRAMMRRGMNVTPEGAARSQVILDEIFTDVSARLADGRRYLAGDRFSAADLAFAALAVPVLPQRGYGATLPPAERLPAGLREVIQQYRDTPAGRFAQRIYDEERRAAAARAA